jgi:hypothetical protein
VFDRVRACMGVGVCVCGCVRVRCECVGCMWESMCACEVCVCCVHVCACTHVMVSLHDMLRADRDELAGPWSEGSPFTLCHSENCMFQSSLLFFGARNCNDVILSLRKLHVSVVAPFFLEHAIAMT